MKVTSRGSILLLFWLFSSCIQADASENPAKIPTLTRLVGIFAGLESDIIDALKNRQPLKLNKLIADDFEMRAALMPANPVPRAEWLAASMAEAPAYSADLEQIAVHDFNDTALVSFLWNPPPVTDPHKIRPKMFVVDTWRRAGTAWVLAIRYISTAVDTGARIPGLSQNEPPIEKK